MSITQRRHRTGDSEGLDGMATESVPRTEHRSGGLRVNLVDPTADPRWAAFVSAHPDGLAFHHPAWLATLADTFGYPPAHLACEDDQGRLHGVLPLVYRRGLIRGRQLWSLPCTAVAGPLTTSAEAAEALIQAAIRLAQEPPAHRLVLHSMVPDLDPGGTVLSRVEGIPTYVIDLPERTEPLRVGAAGKHSVIKRGVKKAHEYGLRLREAERFEDLVAWYRLYVGTMQEKESPPLPFRLFDAAWHYLRPEGMLQLLVVDQPRGNGTELIGGEILLLNSQTVLGEYAARSPISRQLHGHDLIQWHIVHSSWDAGYRRIDLGDAHPESGLARYKRKWGGQPRPMYRYVERRPSTTQAGTSGPSRGSKLRQLAKPAWRRMPLPVAARAGALVYRYA